MSTTVRSVLTRALPKARQNWQNATDLLARADANIIELSTASELLGRNLELIQKQLDSWGKVISGLHGADKTAEENLFEQYGSGGDHPGEMVVILTETIGHLDIKIDQIRAQNQAPASAPGVGPPLPLLNQMAHPFVIPLPAMGLLDFDGSPGRWSTFWANFRDNVDRRNELTPAQKLNYLIGQLKGSARDLVTGYPIVDANYEIVKQGLFTRFGDEFKRAHDLRSELLRLPKATLSTPSLRSLSESVERLCRQLNSFETNLDESPFIITALLEKIPAEIRFDLLKQEKDNGAKWTAKQWREGLATLVQLREAARVDKEQPMGRTNGHGSPRHFEKLNGQRFSNVPSYRAFPVVGTPHSGKRVEPTNPNTIPIPRAPACSLCDGGAHRPTNCPRYNTAPKRRQRLTEQNRCHLCIRTGHGIDTCSSHLKCSHCGGSHHLIICSKYGKSATPNKSGTAVSRVRFGNRPQSGNGQAGLPATSAVVVEPMRERNPSYLMVMTINVYNHRDPLNPVLVPVFFDPGSQNSFIEARLTQEIKPRRISTEELTVGGFVGNRNESFVRFTSPYYSVMLERENGGWEEVFLNRTNQITPSIECLVTSDVPGGEEDPIPCLMEPRILIGVREFWHYIQDWEEVRPGIFKIKTIFGPVFGGEMAGVTKNNPVFSRTCPIVNKHSVQSEQAGFWALENIGVTDSPETKDDEMALLKFEKSIGKDNEGRYEVGLPWKSEEENPPENFRLAFSRLGALVQKLKGLPHLFQEYNDIIRDYTQRGIIESSSRTSAPQHFLPHHAVLGKRLRVVFDASSHEKNVPSLNDALYAGPNLYPDLTGKLIQFRASIFPVWADIEKAFLMIGLRERDREFSKFLWIKDLNMPLSGNNLLVFRFRRITFGIVSCPFLLAATLRHHLNSHHSPLAKEIVENSLLYVDNLLLLADTVTEARAKAREAQELFQMAKMRLREFVGAHPDTLEDIPIEDRLGEEIPSVLGLKWILNEDKLSLSFPPVPGPGGLTRRMVLRTIASFFDPLGLCSPCLVGPKLFFQRLWEDSQGWDDPIPLPEATEWTQIQTQWANQTLTVPRHTPRVPDRSVQLHAFTDASPNAFACVVYLRAETAEGAVSSLVYSRSRLRPKRMKMDQQDGLSIPRLELLGILIGTRALKFVHKHSFYNISETHLWSDSRIALSWLSSNEKMPIFVANRVKEIRSNRQISFHYVRRADNSADLATRPTSPQDLRNLPLWWKGPSWLTESAESWPQELTVVLPPEESATTEPIITASLATVPEVIEFIRFSSWSKLLGTVMYFLRFLSIVGKGKEMFPEFRTVPVLRPELKKIAHDWIVKRIQGGIEAQKGTYLDKTGLVRLSSRLCGTGKPEFEHPLVLPGGSWVCTLLIRDSHQRLCHAGVDSTLTNFLSTYWCRKARRTVRAVLSACNTCKRDRAVKFGLPPMPPLPKSRTSPSRPFENIGMDYLGPTLYKMPNAQPAKAWILSITCLACRAVHLELVSSMSAEHFLLAFRRFVARRGLPCSILSDHGAQFVLAKSLIEGKMEFPIKWTLIPAFSPWSGGVYERINSLIKGCFRRVLGRRILYWEEINTFLTEAESAINSRPITFVSEDPDGPIPLRPFDFILPKANLQFEEPVMEGGTYHPSPAEKLAIRWWATTASIRSFWERWTREYLLLLRERNQTIHKSPRSTAPFIPQVGHIVLVELDEFPRNTWPYGKIVELHGSPNQPRSASVQMATGRVWSRPVSKLIPLEVFPVSGPQDQNMPAGAGFPAKNKLAHENASPNIQEKGTHEERKEDDTHSTTQIRPKRVLKPPRRYLSALTYTKSHKVLDSMLFLCLALLSIFFGVVADRTLSILTGADGLITCGIEGVTVSAPPNTVSLELCCEGTCGSRPYHLPFLFPLPIDNLVTGFSCTGTFWFSPNTSSSLSKQCPPIDGCLLMNCIVCWERIFNLHCSPWLAAVVVGVTFLFLTTMMIIIGCCVSWVRHCLCACCWPLRLCRTKRRRLRNYKYNNIPMEDSDSDRSHREHIWPKRPKIKALTKLGYALAIIYVLLPPVRSGAETISLTAPTEDCFKSENGTVCQFNSVSLLTLLPAGQSVRLIIRGPDSVPYGTFSFKMDDLSIECQPEVESHIRSYKVETLASKRCPGMGSCKGNICSRVLVNETVKELENTNSYPGNLFCLDSSSFWLNLCGGTNDACLFYRNYAVPTTRGSQHVYELFTCPTWEYRIKMKVNFEPQGGAHTQEELELYPGRTVHWSPAKISLTPSPLGQPPAPVLAGKFVGGWYGGALINSMPIDLHCPTEWDAITMNCKLTTEACTSCRADHSDGNVRCHCRDYDFEQIIADPTYQLPRSLGGLTLNYHEGKVWAITNYVPIQLAVKIEKLSLAIEHDLAKCEITVHSLVGCYKCATGGNLKYSCQANIGDPLAEIRCSDGTNWVSQCSSNITEKQVILKWSKAEVATTCEVICPAGKTNFWLEGTLLYISHPRRDYSVTGKKIESAGEFQLPLLGDFKHIFNVLTGLPQIVTMAALLFFGLILFYLFIKFNPILSGYRRIARIIVIFLIMDHIEAKNIHDRAESNPELMMAPRMVIGSLLLILSLSMLFSTVSWFLFQLIERRRRDRVHDSPLPQQNDSN